MVSAMDLVLQTFIDCIFSIQRVLVGTTIAIIIGVLLGIARNFLPKKIKNNKIVNFIFEFPRFPPPIGWMSVIAAEMLSGENGLGYAIELYTLNLQFGLTVLNMIIIGIIGFFLSELVCFFKRLIIPWHDLGENND